MFEVNQNVVGVLYDVASFLKKVIHIGYISEIKRLIISYVFLECVFTKANTVVF